VTARYPLAAWPHLTVAGDPETSRWACAAGFGGDDADGAVLRAAAVARGLDVSPQSI
jgi:hypothetical protein